MKTITKTYEVTTTIEELRPDFTEHVIRGAALLDEQFPNSGWREAIDIDQLELHDGTTCVLGQVFVENIVNGAVDKVDGYKNYSGGVKYLFPIYAYEAEYSPHTARDKAVEHYGFVITDQFVQEFNELNSTNANGYAYDDHYVSIYRIYEWLTEAWVAYLKETRTVENNDEPPF